MAIFASAMYQVATAAAVALALTPSEAWAKGGQWGPLEGKASSNSVVASMMRFGGFSDVGWRFLVKGGKRRVYPGLC